MMAEVPLVYFLWVCHLHLDSRCASDEFGGGQTQRKQLLASRQVINPTEIAI